MILVTVNSVWKPGDAVWQGRIGGELVAMQVKAITNGVVLSHRGYESRARVYTRREAALARLMPVKAAAALSTALLCPMPGLVRSIDVGVGQEVKVGEALCVVEAMKMENVLRAERDGKVAKLRAKPGDSLAVDQVILEYE